MKCTYDCALPTVQSQRPNSRAYIFSARRFLIHTSCNHHLLLRIYISFAVLLSFCYNAWLECYIKCFRWQLPFDLSRSLPSVTDSSCMKYGVKRIGERTWDRSSEMITLPRQLLVCSCYPIRMFGGWLTIWRSCKRPLPNIAAFEVPPLCLRAYGKSKSIVNILQKVGSSDIRSL